ncbi:SrfA family protein [Sodalis sp. dw_96]|uniref:SrfA family protein n=1 Tax=Sodalis sp. dw_96 TaxID=2719794 RepID=UPI0031F609AA
MGLFCVSKSFLRSAFLRSGSLDGILALGEDGQPVYASALQLRETLRLRGQRQLLDCLAIPQPHEQGERLDWYSPIEGKVTSWAAASDRQRASALHQLELCQATVADISRRAQRAEKAAQKLFGMLLAKALQFPDQNHVYLVGNKPVLTFWGFVKLDEKSRADPLDCLRQVAPDSEPVIIPARHEPMDTAPAIAPQASQRLIPLPDIAESAGLSKAESAISNTDSAFSSKTESAISNADSSLSSKTESAISNADSALPSNTESANPNPVQRVKPETAAALSKAKGRRRLRWILPALALAAILVFKVYGYLSNSPVWPPVSAPVTEPHVLAPSSPMTAPPAGQVNDRPASADAPALPGKNRPTTAINPAPAADGSGAVAGGPSAGNTDILSGAVTASAAGDVKGNASPAYATAKGASASADDKTVAGAGNSPSNPDNRRATANDATGAADGGIHPALVSKAQVTTSSNSFPLTPLQMKNALRLPALAVKAGSTAFFNGRWRVNVDSKNPVTGGKAVSFDYLVKNGGGVAKIHYGGGISCRADVHAGLMKSGNLVIRSQDKARCSDGSTYRMPQIVCKQTLTGIADCQSRYDNDQIFPTQIKRENEK